MSIRIEKINEIIKNEVSFWLKKIIESKWGIVSVTKVETSSDLSSSCIWVSFYKSKKKEELLNLLIEHTSSIQKIINKKLPIKKVPKINFKIDESADYFWEIEGILRKINKKNNH